MPPAPLQNAIVSFKFCFDFFQMYSRREENSVPRTISHPRCPPSMRRLAEIPSYLSSSFLQTCIRHGQKAKRLLVPFSTQSPQPNYHPITRMLCTELEVLCLPWLLTSPWPLQASCTPPSHPSSLPLCLKRFRQSCIIVTSLCWQPAMVRIVNHS